MDVPAANPRGFCAGVNRSIIIAEQVCEQLSALVYLPKTEYLDGIVESTMFPLLRVLVRKKTSIPFIAVE